MRPVGPYALETRGDERLNRLELDDLPPSESALLAAKPHDLLFERNERSASLSVSLATHGPERAGPIPADATARSRQPPRISSHRDSKANPASTSATPAAATAWIGACQLESWHHADGTARHLASYYLENSGRNHLRLTMPPHVSADEVHDARIDGVPTSWLVEAIVSGTRRVPKTGGTRRVPETVGVPETVLSVNLPAERRSLCLTIEWTVCGPPLGIIGSLTASLPEPDVPVLGRRWIAWLPPGYEGVGLGEGGSPIFTEARAGTVPAATASAEMRGWIGRCVDVPAGAAVALRYARTASMQLLGAVVFLLAAGWGCCTARRRAAVTLALLLAGFCAAAMTLPDAYVPVAWGGLSGVLFCLALRCTPSAEAIRSAG